MRVIWNIYSCMKLSVRTKNALFIISETVLFALLGLILWDAVGRFCFDSASWMICFIGYPGFFIGFLGSVLHLYNHKFA